MKKRLVYIFGTLVLISILYYNYRYRHAPSFENRIPTNATMVLNIDLIKIENELFKDLLKHPSLLFSFTKDDTLEIEEPDFSISKGIEIPRNILFYTNDTNLKSGFYSSVIELNDSEEFTAYLKTLDFSFVEVEGIQFFTKKNIVFAIQNDSLLVIYTSQKSNELLAATVRNLFEEKEFLTSNNPIYEQLEASESDLVCITPEGTFNANFEKGAFTIEGNLINSASFFNVQSFGKPNDEVIGYLSTNIKANSAKVKSLIDKIGDKEKMENLTKTSLDSIINKWSGGLYISLNGISKKTDTIVTYTYDDNFNKIANKTIQEEIVPQLYIKPEERTNGQLYIYLQNNGAIKSVENNTIFTLLPWHTFYANNTPFSITTIKKPSLPSNESSTSVFNFYLDVDKYISSNLWIPNSLSNNDLIQLSKDVTLDIDVEGKVFVSLTLKGKERYFLGQLIFLSKKKR